MKKQKNKDTNRILVYGLFAVFILAITWGVFNNGITGKTVEESYTFDLTPAMTDYNKPDGQYKVIPDDQQEFNWKAFDNSNGVWYSGRDKDGVSFDFGAGNEKQIEKYSIKIVSEKGAPKNWALFGYNSITKPDYIKLDSRNESSWSRNEKKVFYFDNSGKYRYYRIYIFETTYSNVQIDEIELMEKIQKVKDTTADENEPEDIAPVSEELPAPQISFWQRLSNFLKGFFG